MKSNKCKLTAKQLKTIREIGKNPVPPKEANGFSLVEWGGHRYVYEFDNCIVKITAPGDKTEHNQIEAETYKEASPRLKKRLAPVLDHAPDYSWLVMPKVETVKTGLSDIAAHMIYKELSREIHSQGFMCWDLDVRQVGRMKAKPVIVDYGFGVSCPISKRRVGE